MDTYSNALEFPCGTFPTLAILFKAGGWPCNVGGVVVLSSKGAKG